jgi:hypothetical protein
MSIERVYIQDIETRTNTETGELQHRLAFYPLTNTKRIKLKPEQVNLYEKYMNQQVIIDYEQGNFKDEQGREVRYNRFTNDGTPIET